MLFFLKMCKCLENYIYIMIGIFLYYIFFFMLDKLEVLFLGVCVKYKFDGKC